MDRCRIFKSWVTVLLLTATLLTGGVCAEEYTEAAIVSARLDLVDPVAMRLAVRDLMKSHPESYTNGPDHLRQIDSIAEKLPKIKKALKRGSDDAIKRAKAVIAKKQAVLLVDTFDNMTLIHESEGSVLLEPIPLLARKKPPVIADRADPACQDAIMYIENVYTGPGLKDVPVGSVKALQLMRRWTTAMCGEIVSSYRLSYPEWQKIYNVGLRIVIEADNNKTLLVNKISE